VFEPKGNTFAFVDQSSDRIQVCEVASGLQCRSFAEGEGATWVAGFSPGGQQLAYTSVAGARVRLRVVSLPDRRVSDLGLTSRQRCAIRWTDESRLWAFRPEESQWTELDVSSRTPTGRTESVARLGADGCPEPDGSVLASPLGVVSEREALLWLRRR
jgi:hypothetical protein